MYYIKKVIEDTVVLVNNFETKEVPISELRSINDTILGYNRLTGSVKVVSTEEIKGYIISKYKLCNIEPPMITSDLYARIDPIIEVDEEQEVVNVTLSTNMVAQELIQGYTIYYPIIFVRTIFRYKAYFPDCEEVHINLIYDINGIGELKCDPIVLCAYSELLEITGGVKRVHLDSVSFTDSCDFTKFDTISGLFQYVVSGQDTKSIRNIDSYCAWVDITDCVIDMSNIVFDSHTILDGIVGGILPLEIYPPKFTDDCNKPDLNAFVQGAILNDELDLRKLCKLKGEISSDNIRMSYCIAKHPINLDDIIGKGIIFDNFTVYDLTLDTYFEKVERGDYISGCVESYKFIKGTLKISNAFFGFINQLSDDCKHFLHKWRTLDVWELFMTKYEKELKEKGGYYPCKILSQLYVHMNMVDISIEFTENDDYRSEKFALYKILLKDMESKAK